MPSLYKIRTHGEMFTRPDKPVGYADVTIHWFREGRLEPAFPYTWTVPGWEDMILSLDPRERNPAYARKLAAYVDQLFTAEEVLAIKDHFTITRAVEIEIEEISVPLLDFEIPFRQIPPEPAAGADYGFIDLNSGSNGPLPFKVTGYFDMEYSSPYERYQVAAVKSLMETSGLTDDTRKCSTRNELTELCEKLNVLRNALMGLQQSLNIIDRQLPDSKQD